MSGIGPRPNEIEPPDGIVFVMSTARQPVPYDPTHGRRRLESQSGAPLRSAVAYANSRTAHAPNSRYAGSSPTLVSVTPARSICAVSVPAIVVVAFGASASLGYEITALSACTTTWLVSKRTWA